MVQVLTPVHGSLMWINVERQYVTMTNDLSFMRYQKIPLEMEVYP